MKDETYTIIIDYSGGIYIEQVKAEHVIDSFGVWLEKFDYSAIADFGKVSYSNLYSSWHDEENKENKVVQLNQLKNVWCLTFIVRGKLFLVHIVKTDASQ